MKQVALSDVKDDLSKYLRLAEKEEIVITRHGKPAGVLVGFASEDEWFDYKLDCAFRAKVAEFPEFGRLRAGPRLRERPEFLGIRLRATSKTGGGPGNVNGGQRMQFARRRLQPQAEPAGSTDPASDSVLLEGSTTRPARR